MTMVFAPRVYRNFEINYVRNDLYRNTITNSAIREFYLLSCIPCYYLNDPLPTNTVHRHTPSIKISVNLCEHIKSN